MASKNEHLVPDSDLPYYKAATVFFLRRQLERNDLPTNGLKYDLYARLVDAGLQLYNDDRDPGASGSQDDDDQSDSGQDDSDQGGSDEGGSDQDDSDQDDSDQDDSSDGDASDQSHDGHGGGDQGGGKGIKRRRDDDDADGDDHDGLEQRRKRALIGAILPTEIQEQIIESLPPDALWNLIRAAPGLYMTNSPNGINAIAAEARYQRRLDYPSLPPDRPYTHPDSGPVQPHSEEPPPRRKAPPRDDSPDRPLSLLEWVARRATYEARFRASATNRTRIRRIVREYLEAYQPYLHPSPGNLVPGIDSPRDDILYFFRPAGRDWLAASYPRLTPLMEAARRRYPHIVNLLLIYGEPVNELAHDRSALGHALLSLTGISDRNEPFMQAIFALFAGGADPSLGGDEWDDTAPQDGANRVLERLTRTQRPGDDPNFVWPRIDNPLGLSIRDFIADERSNYFDRVLLAMYVCYKKNMSYPLFV